MKRARQERQKERLWLTRMTKEALAYCPTSALRHAIDTLRAEDYRREHDVMSLRMDMYSPPPPPPPSDLREERQHGNRWLARMTMEDLRHVDAVVVMCAIYTLQAEYDRRHRYTLVHCNVDIGCDVGVALLCNDPRYQRDWEKELAFFLGEYAREYEYPDSRKIKIRVNPNLTKSEAEKLPQRHNAAWSGESGAGLHYLNLHSLPDYPTVNDPQAYLKEHITI